MVNWIVIIIAAVLLISADKIITVMNIKAVQKNFPTAEPYSIEKNPFARSMFQKFGLLYGTIIYGIFSLATFFFAMLILYYPCKWWAPTNAWNVAFYILCIFYAFVLMNNTYFLLRYSKLI